MSDKTNVPPAAQVDRLMAEHLPAALRALPQSVAKLDRIIHLLENQGTTHGDSNMSDKKNTTGIPAELKAGEAIEIVPTEGDVKRWKNGKRSWTPRNEPATYLVGATALVIGGGIGFAVGSKVGKAKANAKAEEAPEAQAELQAL